MPQNSSVSKRPAVIVGGQRRRLARRSGVPRSNTMPVLNPASATASLVNNASHIAALGVDRQEGASAATFQQSARPLETSQSTMNFYPPAGVPVDLRPSSKSVPSNANQAPSTPTPSTHSLTSAATEHKKKHSFIDSLKLKDATRALPDQTPLPPLTPSKAAKLLGVSTDEDDRGSPRASRQFGLFDGRYDGPSVRPVMSRHSSEPMLTNSKGAVRSKFKEEDVDPDVPKSKSLWGSGKKKAKKLLDSLSSSASTSKRPSNRYSVASVSQYDVASLESNSIHRIGDYYSQQPQRAFGPSPAPPPRRHRKKGRSKSLDRMTPITEASYDELGPAYRDGEDSTELEVISEYEQDYYGPASTPMLPRSRTGSHTARPRKIYEFEDEVQASTGEVAEETEYNVHPGTPVDLSKGTWQQSTVLHMRSPLQAVEDRLLDATELQLTVRKDSLKKIELDTSWFDPEDSDEEYSEGEAHNMHGSPIELSKAKWQNQGDGAILGQEDVMDDAISTPEMALEAHEFTVNQLEASKLTLDTDVMALKQAHEKLKNDMDAMTLHDTEAEPDEAVAHAKCFQCGEHINNLEHDDHDDDLISLRSSIDLDEEPTVHTAQAVTFTKITPGMVKLVDIPPRKQKQPSNSYVQDWVSAYKPAEQRPISDRLDQDLLADRETPPAPLPKD